MTKAKSRAFNTVGFSVHTLQSKYPHEPGDIQASLDDYLEDMHEQGHEMHSFAFRGESEVFVVFKAHK